VFPLYLLCLLGFSGVFLPASALELPENSGIINVRSYGAKGDGVTDDTEAIQRSLQARSSSDKLVYLPNGTYLVSATLLWPSKRIIVQGQSRDQTVIKLKDNNPGFGSNDPPQPVISTFEGQSTGQAFRNSIYDLTVDIGSGNPNAIAIRFTNNNQGGIRNVTIRSSDPNKLGRTGLALTREWPGPALIENVTIDGFDYGIRVRHPEYSIVFENLVLNNQRVAGLENQANILSIRGLKSQNSVPVIQNVNDDRGLIVVMDGNFTGGSSSESAIANQRGVLYARNITTSGYQSVIKNRATIIPGNVVSEYVSENIYSLFATPQKSLQLPVEEAPEVPYNDFSNWVSVTEYGANGEDNQDDTAAIQRAIDAGKSTVYFPNGKYFVSNTISVRGNVSRIIGLESTLKVNNPLNSQAKPVFRFEEATPDVRVLERFWGDYTEEPSFYWVENASAKTLVLKNIAVGSGSAYRNTGFGRLFIEDVTAGDWVFNRQQVWARQLNPENNATKIVNNGGTLWILGLKTEKQGTVIETTGGGKTEVLGGLLYPASTEIPSDQPAFINNESQLSVVIGESYYEGGNYETVVQETRGGVTKTLLNSTLPRRGNGSMVPLYVGYPQEANAVSHTPDLNNNQNAGAKGSPWGGLKALLARLFSVFKK
jgi:hypothetical protein